VAIGATAADTATNLSKAINDSGTEGTHYGTGTAPNPYLTATVNNTILTVTDRIACSRSLGWDFSQTGTALSLGEPTGGLNGTTVATLATGVTSKTAAFSLEDESLALALLPPLTDWYSDWVKVSGKPFTIYLDAANVTTAIAASYETTTDPNKTVVRAGKVAISDLDNNLQAITATETAEWVRLHLTNANTTASSVNAKVVFA
jgi:hypothetical protein